MATHQIALWLTGPELTEAVVANTSNININTARSHPHTDASILKHISLNMDTHTYPDIHWYGIQANINKTRKKLTHRKMRITAPKRMDGRK